MMSIGRFQLSLNHDDPKVVLLGLTDFRQQVLQEHNALNSIGYNGRSCELEHSIENVLHPSTRDTVHGILLEYITKSPQIEELFVLWNLPGRDEDKPLSSAHMACIAAILHCARANVSFCNSIVSRILCDHLKSLHSQLASGNVELIHSTLGLLLSMARTSGQNCKDVFQKLNLSSQALDAVVQKGKAVTWQCAEHAHSLSTDSRLLVILLVVLVLEVGDETAMLELFAERSLMRKVMHSIGRDSPETLRVVLPGILYALQKNHTLNGHLHDIFDGASVRQLVLLYAHKEESVQEQVHSFVLALVEHMSGVAGSGKRRGPSGSGGGGSGVGISVSRCCANIAQHLEPHIDPKQEEVGAFLFRKFICTHKYVYVGLRLLGVDGCAVSAAAFAE